MFLFEKYAALMSQLRTTTRANKGKHHVTELANRKPLMNEHNTGKQTHPFGRNNVDKLQLNQMKYGGGCKIKDAELGQHRLLVFQRSDLFLNLQCVGYVVPMATAAVTLTNVNVLCRALDDDAP